MFVKALYTMANGRDKPTPRELARTGATDDAKETRRMLHLGRLQLLREVVRRGTVHAAAEALHVSPSAVSQQLRLLADETGLILFERVGRRLRPTEAALRLAEHADEIGGVVAAAEADVARLRGHLTGTFRVAAFPTAARTLLPPVVAALARRHPMLQITIRDCEADESLVALGADDLDLALVDEYAEPDIGLAADDRPSPRSRGPAPPRPAPRLAAVRGGPPRRPGARPVDHGHRDEPPLPGRRGGLPRRRLRPDDPLPLQGLCRDPRPRRGRSRGGGRARTRRPRSRRGSPADAARAAPRPPDQRRLPPRADRSPGGP
ncbi:MAG: hypothetical protein KatS3mg065_0988 [Chloroflexota bacterium]|nr:MAG: hypothetical protein KatS3mg065_0988 [Chloroflexota bacterium]